MVYFTIVLFVVGCAQKLAAEDVVCTVALVVAAAVVINMHNC
jgi:hypothetical protein